jgi:ankyrin repeat protein
MDASIIDRFLRASVGHGELDEAASLLDAHPNIGRSSAFAASVLGSVDLLSTFVERDPACATAKGGPLHWDPLTYLCFSKFLRSDRTQSGSFVAAARRLLDAGANARTGYFDPSHQPIPVFESALYGAAGVARDAQLTQLLLERGADPNDDETSYHAPESNDNQVLRVLLDSGKLNADSLATMLLRKCDWHDGEGIQMLLAEGADPNRLTHWGVTALQQAVRRDNSLRLIELLIDGGADPSLRDRHGHVSAVSLAARRGRADILKLFKEREIRDGLDGVDALLAACAVGDLASVQAIVAQSPELAERLRAGGGQPLAEFAGNGNALGVEQLLDLGIPVDAPFKEGDSYWGVAPNSTPLHVAAWRAQHATVRLLIGRGADIRRTDGAGRTPLDVAVKACVDSHWTELRSPDSVLALLNAGASTEGVLFPSGFAEIDRLIEAFADRGS